MWNSNRIVILVAMVGYFQITLGQAWHSTPDGWHLVNTSDDWGGLFAEKATQYFAAPWVLMAPALFVAWTVFAMNLVLESIRRTLRSVPRRPKGLSRGLMYRCLMLSEEHHMQKFFQDQVSG
ncbi:hypothetical protein AN477_18725 [Alicyclobacillus ferrooxydans]|uniref:Uncharacterized protein n=1 Tax=Alicyclobacillus ferrooxydans TaxID=471514 RepID=A0A0P9CRZ4_9BACL|nr:hypothetical protein AN477_18725 [Alicyclobacillus ferrooxydans]